MENQPVHIIIPVYNTEKFVEKCLNSCLNQSYKNIDLYVINDGSTDDSLKILEKFKNDNRVNIFSIENGGPSKARNIGIQNCPNTGYITFIDSDDWILPNYIESFFETNDSNFDVIYFGNNKGESTKTSTINSILDWTCPRNPTRKIIKTSIVKNNLFNELYKYGEDLLFNIGIFFQSTKFYKIDDKKCGYMTVDNPQSLTRTRVTEKRLIDGFNTWRESFNIALKFDFLENNLLKQKFYNILAIEFFELYGSISLKNVEIKKAKSFVNKYQIIKKAKFNSKNEKRKRFIYLYFKPFYKILRKIKRNSKK